MRIKRILTAVLTVVLMLVAVAPMIPTAKAADSATQIYYNIDFSEQVLKSRINQRVENDCGVTSMATIESYIHGVTTDADKDTVYNALISKNGGKVSANWSYCGYVSHSSINWNTVYDNLVRGYPVVVHRKAGGDKGEHYSVVAGYTGSTTKLETGKFKIVNLWREERITPDIQTSSTWGNGTTINQMITRKNGIAVTGLSGIRLAINTPAVVHPYGEGHGVYGQVVSNVNLTSVQLMITNLSTGSNVYNKTVTPNAKSYNLFNLDSEVTFAKWPEGEYFYTVIAKTASNTAHIQKYFTIDATWPTTQPARKITFKYDLEGGTGSFPDQIINHGSTLTIPTTTPTRAGYTFKGWNGQRVGDNLWHCAGIGWTSEAQIAQNNYDLTVYKSGMSFAVNYSWMRACFTNQEFVFHAVWEKNSSGNDNTGNDNTGNDNTGSDNTGSDNTGSDNTGSDNTTTISSSATQIYYNIDFSAQVLKSRTNQQVSADCAVVSMVTVESYLHGATSAADKKTVYNTLVSKNKDDNYAYWGNCGYVSHSSINWNTVYDNLSHGYPVLVHRPAANGKSEHWAVVAGYKGSTTTLQKDKFVIVDVYHGTGGTDIYTSAGWASGTSIDRMVTRKNGIAVTGLSGIRLAINTPSVVHTYGEGHGVFGQAVSNSNLTSVQLMVTNLTTGSNVYNKTVTPNAKSYNLFNLDSEVTFAKWPEGEYFYTVIAISAAGGTAHVQKYFTIDATWPTTQPARKITYKYDLEGGTGSFPDQIINHGSTLTIPATVPKRAGYTFKGWNVQRLGDSRWYCGTNGWCTEDQIDQNNYTPALYKSGVSYGINYSWMRACFTNRVFAFHAVWEKDAQPAPQTYTITFKNWDGTVLSEKTYEEGATVQLPADPTRPDGVNYTYTFAGWSPAVTTVTGDAVYTATYNKTLKKSYTVIFKNWDGTVLSEKTYREGTTVQLPANPTRPDGVNYTYTFAGWSPAVTTVTGDAVYTATYTKTLKNKKNGWHLDADGTWYYYENGAMVKDAWRKDSVGWCYLLADGTMATNAWVMDSQGWCYIGADGYAVTNCWKQDSSGRWFHLDANGSMDKNAWIADSVGWCYVGADGAMVTNTWVMDSQGWCYIGADGYAVTNCWKQDSSGRWFHLNANGSMDKNAWIADSVGWCYVGADGAMVTNAWARDSIGWYWMGSDGYAIKNTSKRIDGKTYYFNATGLCTNR